MKNLASLIFYQTDIPITYYKQIHDKFSQAINVIQANNSNPRLQSNFLNIMNSKYYSNNDTSGLYLLIVTDNNFCIQETANVVVFDPYKNEDRATKNFEEVYDTFEKVVEYSIKKFKMLTTEIDDNYATRIVIY